MRTREYSIDSVGAYLAIVEKIQKEWGFSRDDPWGPWYRGHKQAHWALCPTLYRLCGGFKTVKKYRIEDEIREEFIVRAPAVSDVKPENENDWEWYFLMQHFGAPTRLLDWTEGALIGLYFAVKDNPGYYDAAVWVLDPYELNENVIGKGEVIPPSATVLKRDKKLVKPWLPDRFAAMKGLPREALAVYPTHISRRISTQRSCFTVHGSDEGALDRLQNGKWNCLVKISIPSFCVEEMRRDLETCGIDEVTIFPDLEGLGRCITTRWKHQGRNLPHDRVLTRLKASKIQGVGVFAITEIAEGTPLFVGDNEELLWVEEKKLSKLPAHFRKLYEDFAVIKERRYGCPTTFNRLTMSWYLNEPRVGAESNVRCDPTTYEFFAKQRIKRGEELTVDYSTYSDPPSS